MRGLLAGSVRCRNVVHQHQSLQTKRLLSSVSLIPGDYNQLPEVERRKILTNASKVLTMNLGNQSQYSPSSSEFFLRQLNNTLSNTKGGIRCAMTLREDVLNLKSQVLRAPPPSSTTNASSASSPSSSTSSSPEDELPALWLLKDLDQSLKTWLTSVFCVDAVELRRITFDSSSGDILEKVARGEAVHSVRSLSELKRRLHNGRRCFGLFHSALPAEPLSFIHIALCPQLATSLQYINTIEKDISPTHAIFYSVNSPHASLSGLDLATRIIKSAHEQLSIQFPTIHTFATLSPIPEFLKWLSKVTAKPERCSHIKLPQPHRQVLIELSQKTSDATDGDLLQWLHNLLNAPNKIPGHWTVDTNLSAALQKPVTWLVTHYLVAEKLSNGLPLDPVARFHLRNGASLARVNWMGNTSTAGLASSAGLMVNYHYDMPQVPARKKEFDKNGDFIVEEPVLDILRVR